MHAHRTNFKASHTRKIMKILSVQYSIFPKAWTTQKKHVKLNSRLFLINLPTTCWKKLGWAREKWKPCFGSKSGKRCLFLSSEREVKTLRGSTALWSTAFIPWGSESPSLKCEQQHLKPQISWEEFSYKFSKKKYSQKVMEEDDLEHGAKTREFPSVL